MDLAKLAEQFLVDDDAPPERLGQLIQRLIPYCVVGKSGRVELTGATRSGKQGVKLVLAARLVASKLKGSSVGSEVTTEELSEFTSLPKNQAIARAKECVDEKFAERTARGSYRARKHKIEAFLNSLSQAGGSRRDS